jgi:hypothetical protein
MAGFHSTMLPHGNIKVLTKIKCHGIHDTGYEFGLTDITLYKVFQDLRSTLQEQIPELNSELEISYKHGYDP